MARHGYVSVDICITKLGDAINNRKKARRLLFESVCSGKIKARGRLSARDENLKKVLGDPEDISMKFWQSLELDPMKIKDFAQGNASDLLGSSYVDLILRERDVNSIVAVAKRSNGSDEGSNSEKRERRRHAEWEDWVAALVMLGHEQRIYAHTPLSSIIEMLHEKLNDWGSQLPRRSDSTVTPYLRRIVDRLREFPPTQAKNINGDIKP